MKTEEYNAETIHTLVMMVFNLSQKVKHLTEALELEKKRNFTLEGQLNECRSPKE